MVIKKHHVHQVKVAYGSIRRSRRSDNDVMMMGTCCSRADGEWPQRPAGGRHWGHSRQSDGRTRLATAAARYAAS